MNTDPDSGKALASNGNGRHGSRWRIAAWTTAALALLVPFVAMRFTEAVAWSAGDFAFAAVLLFGALGAFELAARWSKGTAYRAGAGVALAAGVLLVWANGAVGITDSAADVLFFLLVPAVGILGAFLARFRPRGMARAMAATALALASVAGLALAAGIVPAHNSAAEVVGIAGFFVALFAGSALLFRDAARGETDGGTV
jgi:hypothetical protein